MNLSPKVIAKAITAVLAVVAAGILAGTLPLEPWVVVLIEAAIAGIAVYLVPNAAE